MAERSERAPRVPMAVEVLRTERLSPTMVRIVVTGADLARFTPSDSTDSYVKVLFGHPGVTYPRPLDLEKVKAELPAEQWLRVRSYTVRVWDAQALELTLDFVVHGDQGVAGPWAVAAQPGSAHPATRELFLLGPGGGYRPDASADWHLLIGDESALPAIAVALEQMEQMEQMEPGVDARILVEVHGPEDEIPTARPVTWVHRGDEPVGLRLVAAARALSLPSGIPHAFVHGEAGFVKQLRHWLRIDLGVPKERLSISGYWRYGADDEGWRAAKGEWNREVESAEASAAATNTAAGVTAS